MIIGVLKPKNESIVALVPQVLNKMIKEDHQVLFEKESGLKSNYTDSSYESSGAKITTREEVLSTADIVLTFTEIEKEEVSKLKKGAFLIGKFNSGIESDLVNTIKSTEVKAFDLDLLPRSTIAQSMDVLSALASLSGYKASVLAADHYAGYFPMMTTSAGTVPPAKVLVLGAGVAGLQAIATAKRLGAMVEAFDVRSAVKEEVQSLGAKFIEVEGANEDKDAGGYAVEQSEEFIKKQKELIHQAAIKADVVITSANIPNRKAPLLIEKETVDNMRPGSVIIDMASGTGGNVAVSKDAQTIDYNGLTIIGNSKLYNEMSTQSSFFYSNNVHNFIKFIFKDGLDNLATDNEIFTKTSLFTLENEPTENS